MSNEEIPGSEHEKNGVPDGLLTLPPEVKQEEIAYIIHRRKAARWAPMGKDEQKTPQQANGGEKGKKSGQKGKKADKKENSSEKRRQEEAWEQKQIRQGIIGLTLSGGGIRSATFSLGVLQELAKRGLLPLADYLCTVSGGGYIGSCLSSLMSIPPKDQLGDPDPTPYSPDKHDPLWWKRQEAAASLAGNHHSTSSAQHGNLQAPRFDLAEGNPLLLREQIHHLRKHGDFVMVRQGLLRRETLRSVAWFLIGLLSTLTMYALFVLAFGGLFVAVASNLGGFGIWSVSHQAFGEYLVDSLSWHLAEFAWSIGGGASAGFIIWLILMYAEIPTRNSSASEIGSDIEERGRLQAIAVILLGALMVTCLGVLWPHIALPQRLFGLCLPLGFSLGLLLALVVLNVVWLPRSQQRWNRRQRSLLGAAYGVGCLLLIAALLLPALVWAIGILKSSSTWMPAVATASLAALRFLVPLVSRFANKPGVAGMAGRLIFSSGLLLLLIVFMVATFLLASRGVLSLAQSDWQIGPMGIPGRALLTAVLSLVVFVAAGLLIDFNRIGPHYFYRDRLVETYLQTQAGVQSSGCTRLELVRNDEQLRLKNLLDWYDEGANPAPYHLIQCAINLSGSRDLARRNRMSDHFLFSREFCGSSVTGYVRTKEYRDGKTKLATAMTLSGAAAGSGVGFRTSFAQAFAATLFNIRLGSWLVNPRIYEGTEDIRVHYSMGTSPHPRNATGSRCSRAWSDFGSWWIRRVQETCVLWPLYLAREMFAMTDVESALVNLSDGGHTGDNIGLYPLLQRRCKLILAVDGEADPNYDFGSLAAGISQIFIDENVSVEFNLDALRPEQGDRAKSHFLIGKITYPSCRDVASDSQRTADMGKLERDGGCGWIIYLKSSLTRDVAPASITSYAAFNKEFPHQSTLDQFFDDDQFEAYRALGEHIASTVLKDFLQWCQRTHGQTRPTAGATAPANFEELATFAKQSPNELVRLLEEWAEDKFNQ